MSFPPPPPGPGQPGQDPNQSQYGAPQQYGPPQGYGAPQYGGAPQPPQQYPPQQYGAPQYGAPQYGGGFQPQQGDPGTLDLPWYGIGMVDAVKRMFQKYARFDGRASRGEYWWAALGLFLAFLIPYILLIAAASAGSSTLSALFGLVFLVIVLAIIVPSIALAVRRLHDGGFSGWFYLLGLVPFIGGIIVLVLMCLPSKPEGAKYDRVSGAPGGYYGGPPSGY